MGIRPRRPVERDHFARNPPGFFSRNGKCLDGPIHLTLRVGNRFAGFGRHQAGKFLASVIEPARDLLQRMIAGVGRQGSHRSSRVDRRLDRILGIGGTRIRHLGE
jgi:hypothetical protein